MEFNYDVSGLTEEDAESVNSFEPIPQGRYTLEAEEWEVKTSKNANQYIAVTFIVVSEAYEKRKIWQNYAVGAGDKGQFARKLVKAWALATGQHILAINKESLHSLKGRPFEADVGIEESEGYKPKNKIEAFILRESGTFSQNIDLNVEELKEDDRDEGVPF